MENLKIRILVPITIYGEGAVFRNCIFESIPCYYEIIPNYRIINIHEDDRLKNTE